MCNPAMNRRKHLIWCVKSKAGTTRAGGEWPSRWSSKARLSSAGWHSKTSSRPFDLTSVLCSGEGPSRAHTSLCANSSKASVQKSSGRLSAVEYLARRCSPSMFTVQSAPPFDSQMTMTERRGLPGATMATSGAECVRHWPRQAPLAERSLAPPPLPALREDPPALLPSLAKAMVQPRSTNTMASVPLRARQAVCGIDDSLPSPALPPVPT